MSGTVVAAQNVLVEREIETIEAVREALPELDVLRVLYPVNQQEADGSPRTPSPVKLTSNLLKPP